MSCFFVLTHLFLVGILTAMVHGIQYSGDLLGLMPYQRPCGNSSLQKLFSDAGLAWEVAGSCLVETGHARL